MKFKEFIVVFRDSSKKSVIVKGKSYETVAERFFGKNLKLNAMPNGRTQIIKYDRKGKGKMVGSINIYEPPWTYEESEKWRKDFMDDLDNLFGYKVKTTYPHKKKYYRKRK